MSTPSTAPQPIELTHPTSGARATILVGFGFNCTELRLPLGGKLQSVLWSHPNVASGQERPSGSGVPILFPFPGRIAGGVYTWNGREYRLPANDNRGNAIHGFVHNRPWRLVEQQSGQAVGQFQASVDDPSILELWPGDFRITARYTLEATALRMEYLLENPGAAPLPWGFGTHPYFRLPLGGSAADDCQITFPATRQWELVDLLATGRVVALPPEIPANQPRPFAGLTVDHALTGLVVENGRTAATIDDPQSGCRLVISWDEALRECVIYTPPHREAICIEPLTCVPGAILLQPRGIDAGLRVLAPGESFRTEVRFELTGR